MKHGGGRVYRLFLGTFVVDIQSSLQVFVSGEYLDLVHAETRPYPSDHERLPEIMLRPLKDFGHFSNPHEALACVQ